MTDLMVTLMSIVMLVGTVVPALLVADLPPETINTYPNYVFVYIHQVIVPILVSLSSTILFILCNPKLRMRLIQQIYDLNV